MKRFLSILLVVSLVVSSLILPVSAAGIASPDQIGGSGNGGHSGGYTATYGPPGSGSYIPGITLEHLGKRSNYAVRLKAFPVKPGDTRQAYFEYDTSTTYTYDYDTLVNADAYNTTAGWRYYRSTYGASLYAKGGWDENEYWGIYHTFSDGHIETAQGMRPWSPAYNQIIEICQGNPRTDICNAKDLTNLFNNEKTRSPEIKQALGEYLGLSAEEASGTYYIVAEMLVTRELVHRDSAGIVYETNPNRHVIRITGPGGIDIPLQEATFAVSLAGLKTDPVYTSEGIPWFFETKNTLLGITVKSGSSETFTKPILQIEQTGSYYSWYQIDSPWEYLEFKHDRRGYSGYILYGFGDMNFGLTGGNVAVEYDGDVNTSDPMKFKSTGSLNSKGSATDSSYWDWNQNKWVDSDSSEELLKFSGKIDMTEEYALCFTGTAQHNVNGSDIKIESESKMRDAFENAPGVGYTTGSLRWGCPEATGGAINVGHVWKVVTLDNCDNVGPIKVRFEEAFNASQSYGSLSTNRETKTTDKYKEYDILDGSWLNAKEGMQESSESVLGKDINDKYVLKKDEQLGMGYEFIIRGTPVKSREITVLVEGNEDGTVDSVSCSQTWEENYTTAKNVIHPIEEVPDYTFVGWLVVPYQDDSVTDSIKSSLESSTCEAGVLFNAALSGAPTNVASSQSTTTLGIGSTKDDQPPEGYTVYKIAYKGPPVPAVPGTVVLPAYMLNRYFNNVIQTSSQIEGHPEKFTLARDWTWEKWTSFGYCRQTGNEVGPTDFKKNWVIEYYDAAGGNEFGLDNAMIDRYYPKGTGNWGSSVRSKLTRPWQESMNTEFMPENAHVVDYAFNLVRNNSDFGDARSISGISYKSYVTATGDSDNMLRIKSQFGVVPAVVKKAAPARNSNAVLKTYTETFDIKSRFQLTASATGQEPEPKVHHYHRGWHGTHGSGDHSRPCTCTCSIWYYPGLRNKTCRGFLGQRAGLVNTISYQFTNSAFKYTTKNDLGKGKNDFLGTATSKPLTAGRRNSTAGSITPSNFYRYTSVRYSGVDLLFHPENYMVFKIGGTDFATINTQNYKAAYVMSEVKRTSLGSGMYFFRLNADITSVPGTVYSDSMQGGTGMMGLGGDLVSIPAGSDVTIAADPTGVAIDLYGYALDIVQTEDDGKIGAVGSGRPYNTVVADGEDAYSKWGNDSRAKIKEHFEKWCADMLEVENYAADFQLFVGNSPASGDLKSENFSATIGSVEKGAGVAEEGIYQLVVEKGVLVESKGDYNALISQISTDYGCSTAEAKQMFKESAIYTAIINGMETCKNPKNKSGDVFQGLNYTPDILASWNGVLGGDGNWYDETSRTFVIRRFTNLGNKLCDVIATDKIDYQLAPEGNDRFGEGVNGGVSFEGWWKLNIFFDQNRASEVNDLLLGSSHYYDPQNGSAGFNPANNAYSVLFNGIPVADANFKIPASSTQDFYN